MWKLKFFSQYFLQLLGRGIAGQTVAKEVLLSSSQMQLILLKLIDMFY